MQVMPDTVTEDTIQEQVVDKRNACVLEIGRNVANGFGARHHFRWDTAIPQP